MKANETFVRNATKDPPINDLTESFYEEVKKPKKDETVTVPDGDVIVLDGSTGGKKVVTPKDPAKRKPTWYAAKNMFRRVVKRSRENLTSIIEERKIDRASVEKKQKQKEMKKIISKLQTVENNDGDEDVELIWAVTSGGTDLIKKNPSPPSSQDVVESLTFYYESD